MDRYRKMFDQALEQTGPDMARIQEQRTALARRFHESKQEEVIPMKKSTKLVRNAILIAATVALLSVSAVAIAIGQRQPVAQMINVLDGSETDEIGVFELDGRYYFQLTEDSEPIDITGQFSDTVPYVYTQEMPNNHDSLDWAKSSERMDYVIGGSGDHIVCVLAAYYEGDTSFHGTMRCGRLRGWNCPIWWRTYCYNCQGGTYDAYMEDYIDTLDSPVRFSDLYFKWMLDGLTVKEGTGAVTLTVNGEERNIELDGGKPYVLTVAGTERNTVYLDSSLRPSAPIPWDTTDPEIYDQCIAYEDSRVFAPNAHDIVVVRDGEEVRYAEFVYRPDGTLRYWMPWNCPTLDDLGWLEDYAVQHGYDMDWLVRNVYEDPTDELKNRELQEWPDWLGRYDEPEAGALIANP